MGAGRGAGLAAAAVAVTIWAGWIVATREAVGAGAGAAGALNLTDVALLRFAAPAALLAPLWLLRPWRRGGVREVLRPAGLSVWALLGLFCWGAPFVLAAAAGAARADAAIFGALTPGQMPLWAALFAAIAFGVRPDRVRICGLLVLLGGAAVTLAGADSSARSAAWSAVPYLTAAAAFWAAYAVAFQHAAARTGLTPAHAAGLVGALSVAVLLPAALLGGSALAQLTAAEFLWHFMTQGVLSGVVAVIAFGVAIDRLGAAGAAATSALVPPTAAAMGWAYLGEAPTASGWIAVAAAAIGVALASGAFSRP